VSRWDNYFFDICRANAAMSYDPSTKVGAVIVRPDKTIAATGFNGFPRGCEDHADLYQDRDLKLSRVIHAEMNAILHAREPLHGYTLYVWPFPPCDRCMAHIIQAGITRVVSVPLPEDATARWNDSMRRAADLALEAGVSFEVIAQQPVNPACALRDMLGAGLVVAVDEASFRTAAAHLNQTIHPRD
jgi:dCMP deaminase